MPILNGWTDWDLYEDSGSPTNHSLVRFKDGEVRAKATIVNPDVMWCWLASTDRTHVMNRRDGEDNMHFFVRIVTTLDQKIAEEGAHPAWHKLQLELERQAAEAQASEDERSKTFGELRKLALAKAGVTDHFAFRDLSSEHDAFWERINSVEYERGYTPDYTEPGTPALCDMKLLTADELAQWVEWCPDPVAAADHENYS